MLTIKELSVNYGPVAALQSVSMEVPTGKITALIGANGAGKTTMLNTISGLVRAKSGTIELDGRRLPREPHRIVTRGVVQVPEGRRIFPGLTVKENLTIGAYRSRKDLADRLEEMFTLFPRLAERKTQQGGTLSGGEQQMLAICRGLMAQPKVLLLDEPSLGLAPVLVNEVFSLVERISSMGITVLLVEQNAQQALTVSDQAYVLETGHVVLSGRGVELLEDPQVRSAYLGAAEELE